MARKKQDKKEPVILKEPYRKINWDEIAELASLHISISKIASAMKIARCTLYERCIKDNGIELPEFIEQNKDYGEVKLLRASFKNALTMNNVAMQVFLLKNWCGYKDRQDITTNDQSISNPVIQVYDQESATVVSEFIAKVAKEEEDEDYKGV